MRLPSKTFKAEGIVVRKKNFFEADRILEVLTLEKGRLRVVVKGARKPTSKLSGKTELFSHGEFTFAKGKNLDIVTSVVSIDHFVKATENLGKVSQLFLISEALSELLPREVPNETVFYETINVFRAINKTEKTSSAYKYLYKLVVMLGYGLSLSVCSKCHEKKESIKETGNVVSFETGGILCDNCSPKSFDNFKLSKNTIKILKYIESHEISEYLKISLPEDVEKELTDLITSYLNYIYQNEFKSARFIKNVKALK